MKLHRFDNYLTGWTIALMSAAVAALLWGCGRRNDSNSNESISDGQIVIDKDDARKIAEREYIAKGGSAQFVSQVTRDPNSNGFAITIESKPSTPGGHCVIHVSSDGRVTEFFPGR
ncbi:MAG: hypothetical protein U0795_19685 [Pirellulales bacterium]